MGPVMIEYTQCLKSWIKCGLFLGKDSFEEDIEEEEEEEVEEEEYSSA